MQNSLAKLIKIKNPNHKIKEPKHRIEGSRIGKIVDMKKGQIFVEYSGNRLGPIRAKWINSIDIESLRKAFESDLDIFLLFEDSNPKYPVIIDTLCSTFDEITPSAPANKGANDIQDIIIDGKKMIFSAQEEIVLKCGKGSIILRNDGKIVVKGTNLTSRSTGANKIKGGSVNIN